MRQVIHLSTTDGFSKVDLFFFKKAIGTTQTYLSGKEFCLVLSLRVPPLSNSIPQITCHQIRGQNKVGVLQSTLLHSKLVKIDPKKRRGGNKVSSRYCGFFSASDQRSKQSLCSTMLHSKLVKIDPKVQKRRGGNKVLSRYHGFFSASTAKL